MSMRLLWCAGAELERRGRNRRAMRLFGALLRTAVRCNNARLEREGDHWRRGGDPTESALLLAAAQLGEDVSPPSASVTPRRKVCFTSIRT